MNTFPYFQYETLLSNFRAALETASSELTLSIEEADWLRRLADESVLPDSMRIEVTLNAQPQACECLLIHQRNPQLLAVYLYSPLHGVQGFDNLRQLEAALQAQRAHLGVPTERLQFMELEGAVFEQWSQRLLQQQIEGLETLTASLGKLPSLRSTMAECVKTTFATLMEGITDIGQHRLQVVTGDRPLVLRTETLCDAAMDVFSGQSLGAGLRRRFMRGDAAVASDAFAANCEEALLATARQLPGTFAQTLHDYWDGADNDATHDRRQELALHLTDSYARALLRAVAGKTITTEQFEWLRQALIPDTDTVRISALAFAPALTSALHSTGVHLPDRLVLDHPGDSSKGYFVFTTGGDLQHFADLDGLTGDCLALLATTDCPASIAVDDWGRLQQDLPTSIALSALEQGAFVAQAESLIALVNRRLAYALRFPGAQSSVAAAAAEDALDIRAVIDPRLARLANPARWLGGQQQPHHTFPEPPSQSQTLAEQTVHAGALVKVLKSVRSTQPDMRACVDELLAPPLSALTDGRWGPSDIRLVRGRQNTSLVDFFLKRLSDTEPAPSAVNTHIEDLSGNILDWPSAQIIQEQIELLKLDFSNVYLDRLEDFDQGTQRDGRGLFFIPSIMRSLYEPLLRLELALARKNSTIDSALLDLLQQALDRPEQALANAQFRFRGLSLKMPGKSAQLTLSSAFVLQRATPEAGSLLLWSPLEPLGQFADEATLLTEMDGAFRNEDKLYRWLDLVHAEDLLKWHTHSVLPGVTIPELELSAGFTDVLGHIARTEADYRANTRLYYLTHAIRSGFKAALLERLVDVQALQQPVQKALKRVQNSCENLYFESLLPSWLSSATAEHMRTYSMLVRASAEVSTPACNYLFDIPQINVFTRERLIAGLHQYYPTAPSDPDLITVTFTHFTPNPVQPGSTPAPISSDIVTTTKSLTEFALTHSDHIGTASSIKASVIGQGHPPLELDAIKIRNMVDQLDVGRAFRQLLDEKLSRQNASYLVRRSRYIKVATAWLMEESYQRFLDKRLSLKAVYYLSHVLIKPDALARGTALGKSVSISHLQLRAADGFAPDTVRGMYIIGPTDISDGPIVLYSAYRPDKMLLEFKDQEALRAAILSDTTLQQDILMRLPESVRPRYDHKGFLHPHLFWSSADLFDYATTPGAVELVRSEIDGNALHHLYDENVELLKALVKARTVTTAEDYWKVLRYVLGLALEQSSFFLPGKLAAVLGSLQSVEWLKASGNAVLQRNWGEALADFVIALTSLASSRLSRYSISREVSAAAETTEPAAREIDPGWNTLLRRPSLQQRLSPLQAGDVQLKDMVHNTSLDLYFDPASNRSYAAVDGNVYEVSKNADTWRIIKGEHGGPDLKKMQGHWQVDLKEGLRGGGAAISSFEAANVDLEVSARYTQLASGMHDISALHPVKHAMLVRAYNHGERYLQTCLDNLNVATPNAALPPRALGILQTTFGVTPSAQTINVLRDYTKRILTELLSPSMNVATSKRIVVGLNEPENRDVFGFTYNGDPAKRIFLTETFFDLPWQIAVYAKPPRAELLAHQQAVTLIHELSHQVLKTVDIAYVEASAPFADLISTRTQGGRKVYQEILSYRRDGLSINTSPGVLFKTVENFARRDIKHKDGRTLKVIYRLTKENDLPAARNAFYNDAQIRTDIILANADSLALLITKLGRKRFAPAG